MFGDIAFTYFDQELMRYLLKKTDAGKFNGRYGLSPISCGKHSNFLFLLNVKVNNISCSEFLKLNCSFQPKKRKHTNKHAQNANCRLKKFLILKTDYLFKKYSGLSIQCVKCSQKNSLSCREQIQQAIH